MAHNVYVKATTLSNVNGRIDYITNKKRIYQPQQKQKPKDYDL